MNRIMSCDCYEELCETVFRMKQTSVVLELVLKHLEEHRNMCELWVEMFALKDEILQEVRYLSSLSDTIAIDRNSDMNVDTALQAVSASAVEQRAGIA